MFKHIVLITNSQSTKVTNTVNILIDYLQSIRVDFSLCPYDQQLNNKIGSSRLDDEKNFDQHCDLVIAIGGDGTMLKAAHFACLHNIPLLGINRGDLGFLADILVDTMEAYLKLIFAGYYIEEQRFLLSAKVFRADKSRLKSRALNDVIVRNISRLMEFEVYVDDSFVHRQRSDGLIISSPTGSTAYALSGGGSILHPSLNALELVPICPHSLTNRPIVIDGNSLVKIVVGASEGSQSHLTCDGDIATELAPGDQVLVQKDDKQVRLIHPTDYDYFSILREKLQWGTEIC